MATWFTITFEGEPTETDFERVSELAAEGYTSGQLINEPDTEHEEGPATGYYADPADSVVCTIRDCPGYGTPHTPLRITQKAHEQ